MYPHHHETIIDVTASPEDVFAFVDDHAKLSAHMNKRSWMMAGGRMSVETDAQHGKAVGSKIRMSGAMLGLTLALEEAVTERSPPWRKVWETIGAPQLVVVGPYRMGVQIKPNEKGCELQVFILSSVVAISTVIGCAVAPAVNVTAYDFGLNPMPAGVKTRLPGVLTVERVRGPSWYDGTDILYRLAYQDSGRPQVYSQSRWIASPEELLTQLLHQKLDAVIESGVAGSDEQVASDYLLRVDLIEFSQVFDTPDASHAVVRIRASLIDVKHGRLLAQDNFNAERPAPTPNAAGAVRGLRVAADAVLNNLVNWLIARVQRGPVPG